MTSSIPAASSHSAALSADPFYHHRLHPGLAHASFPVTCSSTGSRAGLLDTERLGQLHKFPFSVFASSTAMGSNDCDALPPGVGAPNYCSIYSRLQFRDSWLPRLQLYSQQNNCQTWTFEKTLGYPQKSQSSSGGFRPGPEGRHRPPVLFHPPVLWPPMIFCQDVFAFPKFRKVGKFAVSIKCLKTISALTSGGFTPWPPDQGLCPWTPLGPLPQTPVIGSSYRARHGVVPLFKFCGLEPPLQSFYVSSSSLVRHFFTSNRQDCD